MMRCGSLVVQSMAYQRRGPKLRERLEREAQTQDAHAPHKPPEPSCIVHCTSPRGRAFKPTESALLLAHNVDVACVEDTAATAGTAIEMPVGGPEQDDVRVVVHPQQLHRLTLHIVPV